MRSISTARMMLPMAVIALLSTASAASAQPSAALVVSVGGEGWKTTRLEGNRAGRAAGADVEVDTETRGQTLEGYGGAFNEKGWAALSVLDADARGKVLTDIFGSGPGLGLNVGRVPVGASDYAMDRYSHDETLGDYAMTKFSIDRDRRMLLPYAKAAKALRPDLMLWASAWSPPTWMKDNRSFDSGAMLDDPAVYAAYALYLAKFAEAWAAEGLPISAIAVQNEPTVLTNYPSCSWRPVQYRTFVRDHLGPELERRGSKTALMLGTFNQGENLEHALAVLTDPEAKKFVSILGLQWDGLPIAEKALKEKRDLRVWMTETDCGNWHWKPGFNPDKPQNDFVYAAYTWRRMRDYFAGGASVYCLWNIVLDETGKSIDAKRPWPQNSPIVVDSATRKVTYTPMYYAFGHFSRYSPAASVRLGTQGAFRDAIAFRDPQGNVAVQLLNSTDKVRKLKVKVADSYWDLRLPGRSFATLIVEK
jgi:glucosylceramidase